MKRASELTTSGGEWQVVQRRRGNTEPASSAPQLREIGLHDLPDELLHLIARFILPQWPYLSRPYGTEAAHFPIAPGLRALSRWGASCKKASEMIQAICHAEEHLGFSQLASCTAYEFGARNLSNRMSLRERFGFDPSGTPAPDQTLELQIRGESELETGLARIRSNSPLLEKLDLQLYMESFSDQAIELVQAQLERCAVLKVLSLKVGMALPETWLNSLQTMPDLRRLELKASVFGCDVFNRLSLLPSAATLECLELSVDEITPGFLQGLCDHAANFPRLHFLGLKGRQSSPTFNARLVNACKRMSQIESLEIDASNCALNAAELVDKLRRDTRVSRLGLHHLRSTTEEQDILFKQLALYPRLKELRWTGPLSGTCVAHIVSLLSDPESRLHALDLDACQLAEPAMLALAKGVEVSHGLHELRLAGHVFGEKGAKALADAILASPSLLALTLDGCQIQDQLQARHLSAAVQKSTRLREFHLRMKSQGLQFDHAVSAVNRRFADAVAKSSSLLHLTIASACNVKITAAQQQVAKNRKRLEAGIFT